MTSGEAALDLAQPSPTPRPLARVYGAPVTALPAEYSVGLRKILMFASPSCVVESNLLVPLTSNFWVGPAVRPGF